MQILIKVALCVSIILIVEGSAKKLPSLAGLIGVCPSPGPWSLSDLTVEAKKRAQMTKNC